MADLLRPTSWKTLKKWNHGTPAGTSQLNHFLICSLINPFLSPRLHLSNPSETSSKDVCEYSSFLSRRLCYHGPPRVNPLRTLQSQIIYHETPLSTISPTYPAQKLPSRNAMYEVQWRYSNAVTCKIRCVADISKGGHRARMPFLAVS